MLTIKDHIKTNFLLAYPVMISMLGQVMTGVADSVMIGRTGATPLAASSLANVVFMLLLTFGIGVSYAITPLVAEAEGRKDKGLIIDILRHGFIINSITGIILVIIILITEPLFYFINQPTEVVDLTIPYLRIISFSILPFMIFQTYRQFGEGLHSTRMAMIIVIVCNLINILLNYLLIYGKFGFPELGLNGAGWATLIARILMGILMAVYIYYGKKFEEYRPGFSLGSYSQKLINRMLNIGIPAGIQFIFEVSAFGFSAIMMGWLGTTALAAHQIAINLATISYMTTSGLGAAATIRIGSYLGQQDFPSLRRAGLTLISMALVIMTVWGIAFIVWRYELPTFYISDQEVIALAAPLLIIAGLFQLSDGMQVVCAGALRGLQDVKIPSLMIFIAYWVIALPLGYWLAFPMQLGAYGIWFGLLIGLTLTALAMYIRFRLLTRNLSLHHMTN
jgi:MATE family multidrug resistance protein